MTIVQELALLAASSPRGLRGDFGLGSPSDMPPWLAIARYIWELVNPFYKKHGYGAQNGAGETREAEARWHERNYGIKLDPEQNITITEGSRSACIFALRGQKGKVILPRPYYPGHVDAVREVGCEPFFVDLVSAEFYVDSVQRILEQSNHGVAAVIFCLDNPVWLRCEPRIYFRMLALARQHRVLVIFDEAYRELAYDGRVSSVFDCKRIQDYLPWVVVTKSASKAFAGAGWKVGVVISCAERVAAITRDKCLYSEGGNVPAQLAYATAREWCSNYPTRSLAKKYLHRAELTAGLLRQIGINVLVPDGGMFLWFEVSGDCELFAREMAKLGFLVRPGTIFGRRGLIRWCLREPDRKTRNACKAAGLAIQAMRAQVAAHA